MRRQFYQHTCSQYLASPLRVAHAKLLCTLSTALSSPPNVPTSQNSLLRCPCRCTSLASRRWKSQSSRSAFHLHNHIPSCRGTSTRSRLTPCFVCSCLDLLPLRLWLTGTVSSFPLPPTSRRRSLSKPWRNTPLICTDSGRTCVH